MYFLTVQVQKSPKRTDQEVSPSSSPLDGNTNLFLGLWFCLFKLQCIISCVNSLITAAPRQPAGVDGRPPEYTCIQWNPNPTQDFTGCVCVRETFPERLHNILKQATHRNMQHNNALIILWLWLSKVKIINDNEIPLIAQP